VTGFGVLEAVGEAAVRGERTHHVERARFAAPAHRQPVRRHPRGGRYLASPTHAAVEIVFVNVNPQSTLLLGQARGAAMSALTAGGLPVAEYTALQVKQAVVGHGKANKEQVQFMVARLLALAGRARYRRRRRAGLRHLPRACGARHRRPGRARRPAPRRAYHRAASCLNAFSASSAAEKSPSELS
jgi:hypothetical protein